MTNSAVDILDKVESPSLSQFGGISNLLEDLPELAEGHSAARLTDLALKWAEDNQIDQASLNKIIETILRNNTHPPALRGVFSAIRKFQVEQKMIDEVFKIILKRASDKSSPRYEYIAKECLAFALLLCIEKRTKKYPLLALLTEETQQHEYRLGKQKAKLLRFAFAHWKEEDLQESLLQLTKLNGAAQEAYFELGLCSLQEALDESSRENIIKKLNAAKDIFFKCLAFGDYYPEAEFHYYALESLLGFYHEEQQEAVIDSIHKAKSALIDRISFINQDSLRDWLSPTIENEISLGKILFSLEKLTQELTKPRWLHAADVLEKILDAQIASTEISTQDQNGIEALITAKFNSHFLEKESHTAYLVDWLDSGEVPEKYYSNALKIRNSLIEKTEQQPGNKLGEDGKHIDSILPEDDYAVSQGLRDLIKAANKRHEQERYNKLSPCDEKILNDILATARLNPDITGERQLTFLTLLKTLITYLKDCLDLDKSSSLESRNFIFELDNDPLEEDLQKDLRMWLLMIYDNKSISYEPTSIASGRADLLISHYNHRYILELKRDLHKITRNKVQNKYTGQAISYQTTDIRLSFLVILDLSHQNGPIPHYSDLIWINNYELNGSIQSVVTVIIPGRRKSPSKVKLN